MTPTSYEVWWPVQSEWGTLISIYHNEQTSKMYHYPSSVVLFEM